MKKVTRLTAWILTCVLLAGCSAAGTVEAVKFKLTSAETTDFINPRKNDNIQDGTAAARGANGFAFKLSAALLGDEPAGNFVCSPYSVWLPLAALVNATDKEHKAALIDALGAAGLSEEDINEAAAGMLYDLTQESYREYAEEYGGEYHNPLRIVNAVFVGNTVTLRDEFTRRFAEYYGGSAINVDFTSREAVDTINRWASENTEGLIKDIVSDFDPNTVAAIANAIYFKDQWKNEFDDALTKEGDFHAPEGDVAAWFMLRDEPEQLYYEDDTLQAIQLEFNTSGGLYILLPKDGDAAGLLSAMTDSYFSEITQNCKRTRGKLLLPRFEANSGVLELSGVLTALGVPLFDAATAPLTGGLIEEDVPVWASSALHKALIEVDEKGTTAAAVTIITMEAGSVPNNSGPYFNMVCDRPFVFILCGRTFSGGNQVLFTGIINDPSGNR